MFQVRRRQNISLRNMNNSRLNETLSVKRFFSILYDLDEASGAAIASSLTPASRIPPTESELEPQFSAAARLWDDARRSL